MEYAERPKCYWCGDPYVGSLDDHDCWVMKKLGSQPSIPPSDTGIEDHTPWK